LLNGTNVLSGGHVVAAGVVAVVAVDDKDVVAGVVEQPHSKTKYKKDQNTHH
jgi:hypothetical protein